MNPLEKSNRTTPLKSPLVQGGTVIFICLGIAMGFQAGPKSKRILFRAASQGRISPPEGSITSVLKER